MLPKNLRADKKDIDLLFKDGKFTMSINLTFKFILQNTKNPPKISFIAPKSVARLAVKRNKLRRNGYIALKKYTKDLPSGLLGVFIFKKKEENILILENEIETIFSKIN